nr:retrotransposon Gag protein [Tanacetum cinerariifolium]
MASGGNDRDAKDTLYKLLQMGTVAEYRNEFEMFINRVTGISESLLKTVYISGLKSALQCALLRSNPTTLGEALFKARIFEARFEDERSTTAIAKANDLNTGVQVQDLELETNVLVDDKQDDAKVVKVMGVANHQNNDEPN